MTLKRIRNHAKTRQDLVAQIHDLQDRLEESKLLLHATKNGEVDALIVYTPEGEQVYTLKSADRPYRSLVEEMSEGALTLSPDGTLLYCNHRFAEMLKLNLDEVLGEPFARFVATPDQTKFQQLLAHAIHGSAEEELELVAGDSSRICAQISVRTMSIEGVLSLSAVVMDITARQQAEAALRASEEHFRQLLSGVKDYAIFMLDPAGHVISWNENAEQIKGYRAEEVIGKHFSKFYPPQDIETGKPEQDLRAAVAQGRSEDEGWRIRKDGTRFWASAIITPLFDEQGNLRGFVKVTRDITRQRQAQEEIRAHAARAEALVRVAARLNSQLDLGAVLKTVCEETCVALNVPVAMVTCFDEARQAFVLAAGEGLPDGFAELYRPAPRADLEASFRETEPVMVLPDVQSMPNLAEAALYARHNLRTMIIAAMWHKGELFGTLGAVTVGEVRQFTPEELALLQGMADQAAQASANARLHERVQRYAVELEQRVAGRTSELELANQKLQQEIVEHAEAEEALRVSEERFRAALADSRITVSYQDRNLRYTWIHNPARGFAVQDFLGKTDNEIFAQSEAIQLNEIKRQALESGTKVSAEVPVSVGDETTFFDLTAEPRRDEAGVVIGVTCVSVDITERKQAEADLQRANQTLISWTGELEQRNREIHQLNDMGDLLQSCLTVEEAYRVIEQSARSLFAGDCGALYVLNNSKTLAEVAAIWGEAEARAIEQVFAPDSCWSLRRGRIHVVENSSSGLLCAHLDRTQVTQRLPFSYLCVPMVAQGEALGVFYLQSGVSDGDGARSRGRLLSEPKQRLAVSVAEHVALALSSLKLRETLHNQAIRDPLTGLFNRRYMEESLERELRRAVRKKSTVGIIMLDLDHFKHFNDTFGHDVGDAILSAFGNFLQRHVRGEDLACRYGGEEFTLILPETTAEEARERAEQVRQEVRHVDVQHNNHSYASISISCGVAIFPEHGDSADTILRAADAALYRAKAEGRDRVSLAVSLT